MSTLICGLDNDSVPSQKASALGAPVVLSEDAAGLVGGLVVFLGEDRYVDESTNSNLAAAAEVQVAPQEQFAETVQPLGGWHAPVSTDVCDEGQILIDPRHLGTASN
jgi:hypothetical protein